MTTLAERGAVNHATRTKLLKGVAAVALLAFGASILALNMTEEEATKADFLCYWAAAHQLVRHQNPYDAAAIMQFERPPGDKASQPSQPYFMRNPPVAFFLVAPLGLVGARWGAILWAMALVAALMVSLRLLWIMSGRPPDRLHLVGYVFPPVAACLFAGQIGIFILFGVVLFLYLHNSRPCLAGSALVLCAMKPHLFLPFGAVLFLWILTRGLYRILTGAVVALTASIAVSLFFDPAGWSHYFNMVRAEGIQDQLIPTVSVMFRLLVHPSMQWLQLLPALAGCLWAVRYFWINRSRWNWMDHGCLLLIVSLMVAPYAWFSDEAILLPAVLLSLYRASNAGRSLLPFGFIAGTALLELFGGVQIYSVFFVWTTPAWLLWYLFSVRGTTLKLVDFEPSLAA